jgi:hypothetical protein
MRFSFPSVDVSDASRRVALCHRSSIYLRPSLYVAGGFFAACHVIYARIYVLGFIVDARCCRKCIRRQ